jgi:hypothetical protein
MLVGSERRPASTSAAHFARAAGAMAAAHVHAFSFVVIEVRRRNILSSRFRAAIILHAAIDTPMGVTNAARSKFVPRGIGPPISLETVPVFNEL